MALPGLAHRVFTGWDLISKAFSLVMPLAHRMNDFSLDMPGSWFMIRL